ncbi:hypothetical protein [Streptomyces sp. NPDC089915]|uniref:hypothetical protein n=1 Tax=Streptomyces sp. NPDC089915 TaxID=3155186 RepID=UPI00344892F5
MQAAGAGPGRGGADAFGDAAAARAVVDVADELGAQGAGEQDVAVAVVAGEAGDGRAVAGLDDGQGGAGAFHLAGGGGQQLAGGGGGGAEDGGEFGDAEAVADGEFEGLALLGGGAGGLGPGEAGELGAAVGADVERGVHLGRTVGVGVLRSAPGGVRPLAGAPLLGEAAQAGPAGEGVEPGPAVALVGTSAGVPVGDGEDVAEGLGGGVVVAQDGQAVGEQPVEVGLVPEGRRLGVPAPRARRILGELGEPGELGKRGRRRRLGRVVRPRSGCAPVRPVCAGA